MAFRYVGHLLFHDRNATFRPEEPIVVDKYLSAEDKFTFIDVIPGVIRPPTGGFHVGAKRTSAVYNSFSSLIESANEWLLKNNEWEVINLETVLLFFKATENSGCHLVPEDTCFPLDGEVHSSIMGLRKVKLTSSDEKNRMWLKRREGEEARDSDESKPISQTLKYVDFIPQTDDDDDKSRFEKLDAVVDRANKSIKDGRLDGKIITIETLNFPANAEWQIDPELTLHIFPTKCVSIIRIFYEKGEICKDLIGIEDFVPKRISGGGFFKKPEFQTVSDCIQRASEWLSDNPNYDFKNAQCLEVKMKSLSVIDTKIMSHSADRGDYIRIFRVAYTKPIAQNEFGASRPIFLTSVIFTPGDQEATIYEIKRKMQEWISAATREINSSGDQTGPRPQLLSAETVEIFTKEFTEEEIKAETENTFQFNRIGTMNSFLFVAFRVYFDVGFLCRKYRSKSISSTISTHKHNTNCKLM
ncbi:hypothetical protein B4U79_02259 [Dinothrombium tinctorium]|uniref:Uncharacterized protein n=1 Tax=Dinothrombium tinctorium TaxID=1965070 RepID=A0A3S3PUS1_9ACAR|nr:hypothetical protein B4U79_15149 [Dinothrombium tinctorium]RWS15797.1 hypothetical protein B4U79_09909 [Dinothrombium tinctorium]RWS16745.1 hypothetical protein B4U79_02259 [Dinothrombium tinctorium]